MHKHIRNLCICLVIAAMIGGITLIMDRKKLDENLIRMHVVANSDSTRDQSVKLMVRDAVLESIQKDFDAITDVEQAKAYLQKNLTKLQGIANQVLADAGVDQSAIVTLCKEAFDTRYYETFTLPAGVYEALRVTIGEGKGHNWWCVAFPTLCVPATSAGFQETALESGLSKPTVNALSGEPEYRIRFFLLDAMGNLENRIFQK